MPAVRPAWVVPGGRVTIEGGPRDLPEDGPPDVRIGPERAHVVAISTSRVRVTVPAALDGGPFPIHIDGRDGTDPELTVARTLAVGVHMVDSPAFDAAGRLYATHSGGRDTKVAVPLYRIDREGVREPVAVEIANPTSMVLGPDGAMYISSRFEGNVYRLWPDDRLEIYATELGVPTGIAFGPDKALYVGDRSGSILRVSAEREVETFASLPPSVAAFHLAFGPGGVLYVTAPTLATHDAVYRIDRDRTVDVVYDGFGRPQGLAFDSAGALLVVDALASASGVYRLDLKRGQTTPDLIVSGPTMVGIALDPRGGIVLCSNETIWKLDVDITPYGLTM